MKKSEHGFGAIGILVVVIVLAVGGFAAYKVWYKNNVDTVESTTKLPRPQTDNKTTAVGTWEKGDFAIKGSYADADVLQINDGTWRMYYATQPEVQGNNFEVYSATSTDGKKWTEEPGIRKTMATFPDVVKTADGKFRMYYQNAGVIKSAISEDGLSFTDETGTRIDAAAQSDLEFDNVAAPTVLRVSNGQYVMVYRGTINKRFAENTPNPTTQLLLWATSTDGLTFTKSGIAVDSRNETLAGQLDGPDLVEWEPGKYKLFSTTYAGVYSFDFDGQTFSTQGELAYAANAKRDNKGFQGQPPGDPSLAKIGGNWYMYHGQTGDESGIHYAIYSNE